MKPTSLKQAVGATAYPGRSIVIGLHEDKKTAVIAYFIMGRSTNSRNRVFVTDGEGIRTQAHDPSKMTDPSLVIYAPVRVLGETTIVTNGDQTDTIYESMSAGKSAMEALCSRTFEPDAPNYTPRISGVVKIADGNLGYQLSILKSAHGDPDSCYRFFYQFDEPKAGVGHFIHTYKCDGDPLPSFEGDPEEVQLSGTIDQIASDLWDGQDMDNRVSMFVRTIDIISGATETRIINKHQ